MAQQWTSTKPLRLVSGNANGFCSRQGLYFSSPKGRSTTEGVLAYPISQSPRCILERQTPEMRLHIGAYVGRGLYIAIESRR